VRKGRENSAGQSRIMVRIVHKGQTRYIPTDYYIDPKLMLKSGRISPKYAGAAKLNLKLNNIVSGYMDKVIDLGEDAEAMTGQQLTDYLKENKQKDSDLFTYAREVISQLSATGHTSLADSYSYTINHLQAALQRDALPFSQFTVQSLRSLEIYLQTKKDRPNRTNSIAIHLRNLRAITNRAIDDGITGQENYIFRRYRIRREETPINDITVESLRKLVMVREYIPGKGRFVDPLVRTADMFILSFYLIGINPVDLVRLKKGDLVNGRLQYRRAKTGGLISIKVEPEAMALIEKYSGDELLLDFLEKKPLPKEARKTQVHTDIKRTANKNLRKLTEKLDIKERLTMTSTRYTWSTLAAKLGVTDSIIDRALGHKSPYKLVPVYTRFEIEQVDIANRLVIDYTLNIKRDNTESSKKAKPHNI